MSTKAQEGSSTIACRAALKQNVMVKLAGVTLLHRRVMTARMTAALGGQVSFGVGEDKATVGRHDGARA